ncbi:MAG TPA: glycosyltransferase family 2 protein [Thermoanaerobaculia bacterium]|jgi:glycosyltransferase involved in cell wall biosynthesis
METPDPSALNDILSALQLVPDLRRRERERTGRRGREHVRPWDVEREVAPPVDAPLADAPPTPAPVAAPLVDPPLVSVVMPSLNQGRFIERTLDSVLGQGYPRLELLVIDGGSQDETVAILERYRERHRGVLDFVSEPDRGQAHAVNKGLDRARGEVIGWLNSDDLYEPGCLGHVARAFAADPGCDAVYGHARYVDTDDRPLGPYPSRPGFDWAALAHECYICQPTVFWRRRVLERGLRLDERLDLCMDYDFWIRLGREHEIRFLARRLASSRIYYEAKTLKYRSRIFDEVFATVRRHYGFVPLSWTLGKAHHEHDLSDPLFPVRRPTWKTYRAAIWLALRHNAARPRFWPRLLREGARVSLHKLRREWAARFETRLK